MDKKSWFLTILFLGVAAFMTTLISPSIDLIRVEIVSFQSIVFVLVMFVIYRAIDCILNTTKKIITNIRTPKHENLKLTADELDGNNELHLRLHNNEYRKDKIAVSMIRVGHKDNADSEVLTRRSLVSKNDNDGIAKGKNKPIHFIKESGESGFSIVEYIDDHEELQVPVYSFGVHYFVVMIDFVFVGTGKRESKLFSVTVDYQTLHKFKIIIKDDD
jgi:hypothetical protein